MLVHLEECTHAQWRLERTLPILIYVAEYEDFWTCKADMGESS